MPGSTVKRSRGSRRNGWLWAGAAAGVLLTARLGLWQLDRAAQKLDLQAQMASRAALPPLAAADLPGAPAAAPGLHYRRIVLQGHWLSQYTVYLDNRQMNGRPGFFVVTPLRLPDGSAVPVQRGWLPRDFIDRSRLAPLPTAAGQVEVSGRLAPPPSKLFQLGGPDQGLIRQNLDLDVWALELHQPMRPLSLQQTDATRAAGIAADAPPPDGLLRQWPAPALDVGKHHGYAFQWFGLSALIAGLALWLLWIRPRLKPASHSEPDPHG